MSNHRGRLLFVIALVIVKVTYWYRPTESLRALSFLNIFKGISVLLLSLNCLSAVWLLLPVRIRRSEIRVGAALAERFDVIWFDCFLLLLHQ